MSEGGGLGLKQHLILVFGHLGACTGTKIVFHAFGGMSIHTVALGSKLGHQFFGSAQDLTIFESYMLSESLRASQDDRGIHLIFINRIQMR